MRAKLIIGTAIAAAIALPVGIVVSKNTDAEPDPARFETAVALDNLDQVEVALESFRQLTEVWRSENDFDIDALPLASWEEQNILFPNLVLSLKGTILRQEMRIAELELADARRTDNGASVAAAEALYDERKTAFRAFVDSATVAD